MVRSKKIVDYTNGKDVFPSNSVGGVCYFLWDKQHNGVCEVVNIRNDITTSSFRKLDEFPVMIRYNDAVNILNKVDYTHNISEIASSLSPFGLPTYARGHTEHFSEDYTLHSSAGISYIDSKEVTKGGEYLNKYKCLVSKTGAEHAGEPDKTGKYRVLTTSMKVIGPGEVCTHSYFVIGSFDDKEYADGDGGLKKIPIAETKEYVDKVMKSYERYREIY